MKSFGLGIVFFMLFTAGLRCSQSSRLSFEKRRDSNCLDRPTDGITMGIVSGSRATALVGSLVERRRGDAQGRRRKRAKIVQYRDMYYGGGVMGCVRSAGSHLKELYASVDVRCRCTEGLQRSAWLLSYLDWMEKYKNEPTLGSEVRQFDFVRTECHKIGMPSGSDMVRWLRDVAINDGDFKVEVHLEGQK